MRKANLKQKNDFAVDHLSAEQKAIAKIVIRTMKKFVSDNPSGGGCRGFFTPEEWRNRGEDYGRNSELVLVYDGGDLHYVCNTSYGNAQAHDYLQQELENKGYFFEQCTGWYGAVYSQ